MLDARIACCVITRHRPYHPDSPSILDCSHAERNLDKEQARARTPVLSRDGHMCCRFDILCVVKDVVDPILDERLARFVIGSHERSHPDADAAAVGESAAAAAATFAGGPPPQTISQDLLRKYITYAKDNCRPRLSSADYDKLATVRPSILCHGSAAHHKCTCGPGGAAGS